MQSVLGHAHDRERRRALGDQVGVRQHDALRIARRARGVKDDGGIVGTSPGRPAEAVPACARATIASKLTPAVVLAVQHHDAAVAGSAARALVTTGSRYFGAGEHDSRAGVSQQRFDLRRLVGRVQRHGDRAAAKDAQVGGTPVRVLSERIAQRSPAAMPISASQAAVRSAISRSSA